ncbi:hypothetical protein DH26_gp090 [Chloriridovirus anopheles1]|uniref:Uncharacterized protein n=1 Tax=Chloriridovirus anopheles1 TaxID=1465751 RepID=W8QN22_9VIRU|nr:hypothetical protein DH26_gp090 [Anopheles minimus iridovirus]AHL67583.1 hypothetical protein AMIV_090 [Anopheles minimus iridovirus]
MDTSTKIYQVDKHKQLIPLNGSMVNFSCYFEVKSKDKKPFSVGVVEQTEMKPKQYKLVEDGYINGQIESDGQLKSYFLVLKSPASCECEVTVALKPKETNPQPAEQISSPHPPQMPPSQASVVMQPAESYFQMKYIVGVSAVVILLYLLWKYRKTIFSKFNTDNLMPSLSTTSF